MLGSTHKVARLIAGASLMVIAGHSAADAQSAAAPVTTETATPPPEEIVVTAQLRSQSVQHVPVSLQVVGGPTLQALNRNSLEIVSQTIPSIHVNSNGRSSELYIRGIGSGINQSFDQSVGLFIDGIYHGRSRVGVGTYLDLDRIEILKGPQSTYFGNNAIAGAFNIVTAKPGDHFSGYARALYGEHGQYALEGAAGGPLSDTFGARIAVQSAGSNGWMDNINSGRKVPKIDTLAGRATFTFKPTTDFDATLRLEASHNGNKGLRPAQNIDCPPPAPFPTGAVCGLILAGGYPTGIGNNKDVESANQFSTLNTREAALTLNYRLGRHVLTSITGYSDYHFHGALDADASPFDRAHAFLPESYHQFSQELRLASPTDQPIEYLAGAYFQDDSLRVQQQITYFQVTPALQASFPTLAPFAPLAQLIDFRQHERSYAVFGSVTWHISDKLQLSGGLRGSWVHRNYDQSVSYGHGTGQYGGFEPLSGTLGQLPAASTGLQATANLVGLGLSGVQSGKRYDHAYLPSARLQYDLDRDLMVYASYAKGFKAGGFNGVDTSGNPANLPYDPEHVDAYEIGLKSMWFDRRLTVNIAAFRSNYRDLQSSVSVITGTGSIQNVVRNAAASVSQGVELELDAHPTPALHLNFSGTYLDAHYKDFPGVSLTATQTFCRATYVAAYCGGLANPVPPLQDLSGKPTQFAPKWSGAIVVGYDIALGRGLKLTPEFTGIYSSSYYLTLTDDPFLRQGSYFRADARITLTSDRARWAVDVIGRNLNNTKTLVFGNVLSGANGSFTVQRVEPRNIAVQLRYKW